MTEYELHYLMKEQQHLMYNSFEIWLATTTALVLAGHFLTDKLNSIQVKLVILVYILIACGSIFTWCNGLVGMFDYGERLIEMGSKPAASIPVLSYATMFLYLFAFVIASVGSIHYFHKKQKTND